MHALYISSVVCLICYIGYRAIKYIHSNQSITVNYNHTTVLYD